MAQKEQEARQHVYSLLERVGWAMFDAVSANLLASRGAAIREFSLALGNRFSDYVTRPFGKGIKKQCTFIVSVPFEWMKADVIAGLAR